MKIWFEKETLEEMKDIAEYFTTCHTNFDVQRACDELGLNYSIDDMGESYVSKFDDEESVMFRCIDTDGGSGE